MAIIFSPPPLGAPVVVIKSPFAAPGSMTPEWSDWLMQALVNRVQQASYTQVSVSGSALAASVSPTPVFTPTAGGLYRVSWFARITTAATTSSSLIVTVGATTSGQPYSQSGPALTGNTTATVQSGSGLVAADQGTPITYSTTYASVGATAMTYTLTVLVENLNG